MQSRFFDIITPICAGHPVLEAIRAGYMAIFEASGPGVSKEAQAKFIETIAPLAVKYAKQYGFNVVSPVIAQSCLETGYGSKMLGNSAFGWKASSDDKKTVTFTTHEGTRGKDRTKTVAKFAAYDSLADAVDGHFKRLLGSSFASFREAKDATTPSEYLHCITVTGQFNRSTGKEIGYSTEANYSALIMSIINKHDLTRYDDMLPKHDNPNPDSAHALAVRRNPSWYRNYTIRDQADVPQAKKPARKSPESSLLKFAATEDLNIRNQPSTKAGVEKRIPGGSVVISDGKPIDNEGRKWLKVKYQGEKYMFAGYCDSTYLKKA